MGEAVERVPVAFARLLRRSGLQVPVGATLAFTRALVEVGVDRPAGVYWAGRASLVRRPEDIALYDRAFWAFFGPGNHHDVAEPVARTVELRLDVATDERSESYPTDDQREHASAEAHAIQWSPAEQLRHKDLAACTAAELDEAYRLIAELRVHADLRRSRRHRAHHGRGRPDLRRSVGRALRTDGEVLQITTTRPGHRPRRLVLLIDVSGSMEPYARALVRFAHATIAARRRGQVEAFALGTRLTRVTRELNSHDPDGALCSASEVVVDWAGGTRLGEGLRQFNDEWGVRGLARGSTVVILSDGWDRGQPEILGGEMARLSRVAHRVIWVNPLRATPGYAPLARGMAAALPHVDELVDGHSVASLEALARLVAGGSRHGEHGRRTRRPDERTIRR